jgi:hypothetical protein
LLPHSSSSCESFKLSLTSGCFNVLFLSQHSLCYLAPPCVQAIGFVEGIARQLFKLCLSPLKVIHPSPMLLMVSNHSIKAFQWG